MSDSKDRLDELQEKLDRFLQKQEQMQSEVNLLRSEIRSLQLRKKFQSDKTEESPSTLKKEAKDNRPEKELPSPEEFESVILGKYQGKKPDIDQDETFEDQSISKKNYVEKLNFERLLGENLINKIGIIITVIGVAIGSNYVIENDLISPLARIIIGYIFSAALLTTAYRLKDKYLNYSAVITGGAMASFYLITFAAYSFYGLIPQIPTFIIMTIITAATIVSAVGYNKEWVSVFGLVGGYAIPFLVGGESSNHIILFGYILFLNLGVLMTALLRYWKILYYSAFVFTWLIYLSWFSFEFSVNTDLISGLLFSALFFLIFYTASIAYKIQNDEKLTSLDISAILANTFLFFGIGYRILDFDYAQFHGVFTVLIAFVHFSAGQIIKRFELTNALSIPNFINGLVLVFLTLAIPIQFQDQWITMAWSLEALLLIWMGRKKELRVFETLAYPVIVLAFLSLLGYWIDFNVFNDSDQTLPFINSLFGTFLVFWGAFCAIQYVIVTNPSDSVLKRGSKRLSFFKVGIPAALIFTLYMNLLFEINNIFEYWDLGNIQIFNDSGWSYYSNPHQSLWILIYSFTFVGLGILVNKKWFRIKQVELLSLGLYGILFLFFFSSFFTDIKLLRELYLGEFNTQGVHQGVWNIIIRYVLIGFAGWGILNSKKLTFKHFNKEYYHFFEIFLAFTFIFILSSELIQWLDIVGFQNSYKLGLSILWGACSLGLIFYGIQAKKRHLRISSMFIFFVTLLKLFFYDISHLSTISKTIVFISLGILLLGISYLYNRFKDDLFDENKKELV